jgi:hypothetical protein
LVSALNGSADDGHAHNPSLSGEEGEYTPRRLYCVRPDSLCCRSDPVGKSGVHDTASKFCPGYLVSTVRCSINYSNPFMEYITMPPTLANGGLEISPLLRQLWSVKTLTPSHSPVLS